MLDPKTFASIEKLTKDDVNLSSVPDTHIDAAPPNRYGKNFKKIRDYFVSNMKFCAPFLPLRSINCQAINLTLTMESNL